MNRQALVLALLGAVLVVVAFALLVYRPKSVEVAELREEIERVEAEQRQLRQRVATLEDVRARAPEIEAAIVAAESVLPREVALPSALRQLQLAADESGAVLLVVSPSRPAAVDLEEAPPGLAQIDLTIILNGGYFQILDFVRRVEDPAITPRGVLWTSVSIVPEEYPRLNAAVSARMFALLGEPVAAGG